MKKKLFFIMIFTYCPIIYVYISALLDTYIFIIYRMTKILAHLIGLNLQGSEYCKYAMPNPLEEDIS